jgi:hypothetical protein
MLEKIYVSNDPSETAVIESAFDTLHIRYEVIAADHVMFGSLPSAEFYVESSDRERALYEIRRINAAEFLTEEENPSDQDLAALLEKKENDKKERLDSMERGFLIGMILCLRGVFVANLLAVIVLVLDRSGMLYRESIAGENRWLYFAAYAVLSSLILLLVRIYSRKGEGR